tara:strand:+ start:1076 stop:2935 length:1860 start_codon:yes stop_codon:yes gene_type:complete
MSVLQKLTEGIAERNLRREGAAVVEKWERTGLLEGIEGDAKRQGMSRLLENQAAQLLKEASAMSTGDVEGFASVAFPIVRRVFGGLLANDLVSVQPMSLPSGLIFFLDFTLSDQTTNRFGLGGNPSVYGGGVTGSGIQTGVTDITEDGGGFYELANAYSSPTGSVHLVKDTTANWGTLGSDEFNVIGASLSPWTGGSEVQVQNLTENQKAAINYDPDVLASSDTNEVQALVVKLSKANADKFNFNALGAFHLEDVAGTNFSAIHQLRRLTHLGIREGDTNTISYKDTSTGDIGLTFYFTGSITAGDMDAQDIRLVGPLADTFETGDALGSVRGASEWALEEAGVSAATSPTGGASSDAKNQIPEIDIQVESIAVTAVTKKLKAKWTPELGQDLNAYHNLDAEVELTQILSEHIALEIDREIVLDLIEGATASTYYWSRAPGLFVNRVTGAELGASSAAPDFTGTVSEWYETLVETINDVSAQIHRKTLRGGANFLVTSPEVANILEFTAGFRANITADADRGTVGAVNVGSMSKKWDVWVDPYFPRNVILVGRRGGSFLESGYVYAPYVPLQVTPTIFGPEDFVPRKGVMTRYAKKMVRPDMYGLVIVRGLLGEAGATS